MSDFRLLFLLAILMPALSCANENGRAQSVFGSAPAAAPATTHQEPTQANGAAPAKAPAPQPAHSKAKLPRKAQVPASNAQAALDPLFLMPSSAVLDTAPAKAELQRLLVELLK